MAYDLLDEKLEATTGNLIAITETFLQRCLGHQGRGYNVVRASESMLWIANEYDQVMGYVAVYGLTANSSRVVIRYSTRKYDPADDPEGERPILDRYELDFDEQSLFHGLARHLLTTVDGEERYWAWRFHQSQYSQCGGWCGVDRLALAIEGIGEIVGLRHETQPTHWRLGWRAGLWSTASIR